MDALLVQSTVLGREWPNTYFTPYFPRGAYHQDKQRAMFQVANGKKGSPGSMPHDSVGSCKKLTLTKR